MDKVNHSITGSLKSPVVTEAQRHHFRTFGFVAFPQLFTPAEIERYGQALERSLRRKRGRRRFRRQRTRCCEPNDRARPAMSFTRCSMMNVCWASWTVCSARTAFSPVETTGNMYVGSTPWHTDVNGVSPERAYAPHDEDSLLL